MQQGGRPRPPHNWNKHKAGKAPHQEENSTHSSSPRSKVTPEGRRCWWRPQTGALDKLWDKRASDVLTGLHSKLKDFRKRETTKSKCFERKARKVTESSELGVQKSVTNFRVLEAPRDADNTDWASCCAGAERALES